MYTPYHLHLFQLDRIQVGIWEGRRDAKSYLHCRWTRVRAYALLLQWSFQRGRKFRSSVIPKRHQRRCIQMSFPVTRQYGGWGGWFVNVSLAPPTTLWWPTLEVDQGKGWGQGSKGGEGCTILWLFYSSLRLRGYLRRHRLRAMPVAPRTPP